MEKIVVVGAGLVGSLLSMYLAGHGHQVEVHERQPDPRKRPAGSGRSINLTLCERGFAALDRVGAGDVVRALSVPARGRLIHPIEGEVVFQPYGNSGEAIHSIARSDLNRALVEHAEQRFSIPFHFGHKCVGVELSAPEARFEDAETGALSVVRPDRIIGADGAFSAVRLQMQKTPRFNYAQEYLDQGYKELTVPAERAGDWSRDRNAIRIWPRGNYMLIGFPNLDESFTLSLHLPYEGDPSFESLRTPEDLLRLFRSTFPDALPRLPALVDEFFSRPATPMITIRCSPWVAQGKVALVGDAAHAIVPSYGQGANAGFEDCSVLGDCLARSPGDVGAAFDEYQRLRKPNAEAIADLALAHFAELRDAVGDPAFLLRKEIERRIQALYPDRFSSLYAMVTFSTMSYVDALRADREHQIVVDRLMLVPGVSEAVRDGRLEGLIREVMQ